MLESYWAEREKRSPAPMSVPEWLVPWWGKLLVGICVGSALTIIPSMMIEADSGAAILLAIFLIPGSLLGMIFSGGNLHEVNKAIVGVGSFVFYVGVTYFALWIWADLSRQRKE